MARLCSVSGKGAHFGTDFGTPVFSCCPYLTLGCLPHGKLAYVRTPTIRTPYHTVFGRINFPVQVHILWTIELCVCCHRIFKVNRSVLAPGGGSSTVELTSKGFTNEQLGAAVMVSLLYRFALPFWVTPDAVFRRQVVRFQKISNI